MLSAREQDQLAVMFCEHNTQLVRWLRARFPTVAEDAAGQTWATLTRVGPGRVRPDTAVAFLRTVASHEALRLMRDGAPRGRHAPLSLNAETDGPTLREQLAQPGSDRQAHARAELGELLDAIGHLSRGQQIAVIGRIVGLSYDEIGQQAGHPTTAGTAVNTWANRGVTEGRAALRDRLGT